MDYSACLMNSRITGEALTFSYSEHNREVVLKQLEERLETMERGDETPYMREENDDGDMLWLLYGGEDVPKGIYNWNCPDVDLAVVASPALMALIMGEYELAVKLCEAYGMPRWSDKVEELYQEKKIACIGGGSYTFGEACLLSGEMSMDEKMYFQEKGYYDAGHLAIEESSMLCDMQFGGKEQTVVKELWRPIQEIKVLRGIQEDVTELLAMAVIYALKRNMDEMCEDFWNELYLMFPKREEHQVIVDALHEYFLNACGVNNLPPRFEKRLVEGVKAYFRYEEVIPMTGDVEEYVLERLASKPCVVGKWRPYLERYFDAVTQFEGTVSNEWQQGMFTLLQSQDSEWMSRGFRNGFLKKDYISEYIDFLLEKYPERGGEYSKYVSRLIQMKWQEV